MDDNSQGRINHRSRELCAFTKSRLEKTGEITKAVSTNKSSITDEKSDSDYITLTFKSGLSLPIRSNSGSVCEKQPLRQNTDTRPSSNNHHYDKVRVDDKLNFSLFNSTQSTIGIYHDKRNKSHALVTEPKQATTSSITSITRRILNEEEVMAEQFCLVFSSTLSHLRDRLSSKKSNNERIRISHMTINPNFLDIQDGNANRFLQLVDKIIRSTLDHRHGPETNDAIYFLNDDLSSDCSNTFGLPRWFELCVDHGHTSVKLLLFILARMEISVREAHRRYLLNYPQKQPPEKLSQINRSIDINYARNQRETDTNITTHHQNPLEPIRQLLTNSRTSISDTEKMEMLDTLLRLWRGNQTKKTYSTILLDTSSSQNYGPLYPGLSLLTLQDILLVPFSVVSEFSSVYGEMKETLDSINFLTALSNRWKMIYLDNSDNFSLCENSSRLNNLPEPASESLETFYDGNTNTVDDSSQVHEDSKNKKKKKKKKKVCLSY